MAYSSISLITLFADAAVDGVVVGAQAALRTGVGHLLDEYDDVHACAKPSHAVMVRHRLRDAAPMLPASSLVAAPVTTGHRVRQLPHRLATLRHHWRMLRLLPMLLILALALFAVDRLPVRDEDEIRGLPKVLWVLDHPAVPAARIGGLVHRRPAARRARCPARSGGRAAPAATATERSAGGSTGGARSHPDDDPEFLAPPRRAAPPRPRKTQ